MKGRIFRFIGQRIPSRASAADRHPIPSLPITKTEKYLFQEIELTQDGIEISVKRLSNETHA